MASSPQVTGQLDVYLHTTFRPDCDYVDGEIQERNAPPTRYRIPDVCVVSDEAPFEQVMTRPPLLCIEILSSEDRWSRITERLEDYRSMGVPNLWVIDPLDAKAWMWSNGEPAPDWTETAELKVPGTAVRVDATAMFAALAERKREK